MAQPAHDLQHFIGNADEFPILRHWDFYNHAGVCPLPTRAGQALRRFADIYETRAYLDSGFYREIESLRAAAAQLMNAGKDEIAFVKNTSEGISIVANGIDWQWGDRIVTTNVEYPANVYPWMEAVRTRGCKLVMVEEETDGNGARHVPTEKILEAASDPKTKLVTLSHVEFASGQRHDLAKIGAFCRKNGKLFCVDAIQSLGVLPVDVKEMCIDFLAADGHKWLLGPEGAGVFYCRRELIEHVRPVLIGWMNVVNNQAYGSYDYTLKSDAGRFECGTYNIPGLLALHAALDLLFNKVGLAAVSSRVKELTDHLIARLREKGYAIASPRAGDRWSGIVTFTSPTHDHEQIVRVLRKQHRTEIALREGRLRVSPHFYNTIEQIDRLIDHLPGH